MPPLGPYSRLIGAVCPYQLKWHIFCRPLRLCIHLARIRLIVAKGRVQQTLRTEQTGNSSEVHGFARLPRSGRS